MDIEICRKSFVAGPAAMALMAPQLMSAQRKAVAAPMEDRNQVVDNTLDSLNKARFARPLAGSSRKGDNPVLFLVGNSTMRTGTRAMGITANGDGGVSSRTILTVRKSQSRIMHSEAQAVARSMNVSGRMCCPVYVKETGS